MIRPSNLSPEFSVVDSTKSISFSWKSNIITQYGYQIKFYNNETDALLFDTGLIVSNAQSYTLNAGTIENGKEIKYFVKQFGSAETSIDSEYILIKTALAPQVTIPSIPETSQEFEFVADVILDSSATIQKYRYLLYDNFNIEVYNSGYIYDYVPKHKIVGLLPNFPYKIACEIIDSNGQSAVSPLTPFIISATVSQVELFTLTPINESATVQIDFRQINQTVGTVVGSYSYISGKFGKGISLPKDSYLTYDKTIPQDFSLSFYCKLPNDYVGDVVTLGNNEYRVFYQNGRWGYQFGDYTTAGRLRTLPSDKFIKIILKYSKVIIQTIDYIEII